MTVTSNERLRILMVEDLEEERAGFQSYAELQDDVEKVWCVPDVEEGVRIMLEELPDVVLLDWMLDDDKLGEGFLAETAKLGENRPTTFVTTVNASPKLKKKLGKSGLIEQFLSKNVKVYGPEYLMQKVRLFSGGLFQFAGETEQTSLASALRKGPEIAAEIQCEPFCFTYETLWPVILNAVTELGLTPNSSNCLAMTAVLTRTILLRAERGKKGRIKLESEVYARTELQAEDGKKMGVDGVRSGIRTAVNVIYSKGDPELIKVYCPNEGDMDKGNPEPKQFILTFADKFVTEHLWQKR